MTQIVETPLTKLTRRDMLKISLAAAALAGCNRLRDSTRIVQGNTASATPTALILPAISNNSGAATADNLTADPLSWLAVNRLTFGPRTGDVARVQTMGVDAFIDEQLGLDDSADKSNPVLNERLAKLDVPNASAADIRAKYDAKRGEVFQQMQTAAILRAVYSQRQLYELIVDFWSNHFNIYIAKGNGFVLKPTDDREVIRKHALGKFRDLLGASAHSPAMLFYLDNQANRKGKPDENYARELLELHTLGVDGGYSEKDVVELARALTGWSISGIDSDQPGEFQFRAQQHDDSEKNVMGMKLPAKGGQKDVETILDMLADHPNTMKYVCGKIAKRFISDSPPASVVQKGVAAWVASKGDLKTVFGAILHSDEFKQSAGQKLKRPFEFIAGACRSLGADVNVGRPMLEYFRHMGQPLFFWQPPNGYPDVKGAWFESSSLLARWNFGLQLATGSLPGNTIDITKLALPTGAGRISGDLIDTLSLRLLGSPLPAATQTTLQPFVNDKQVNILIALLLASPLYQVRG